MEQFVYMNFHTIRSVAGHDKSRGSNLISNSSRTNNINNIDNNNSENNKDNNSHSFQLRWLKYFWGYTAKNSRVLSMKKVTKTTMMTTKNKSHLIQLVCRRIDDPAY